MSGVPRVLVAGGSIGGLTTAVLLRDLGCDVEVFERSSAALEERGAGIVVLPITERYFVERGGDDRRVSLRLRWWKYVDRAGTELSADLDDYRFSGWNTLYRALLDAFDPGRYHLGSEMVAFDQDAGGVTLRLADGTTARGDLLVCSDGMASTARRILLPGIEPTYAGYVAWRGVTAETHLSKGALADLEDSMIYQVLPYSHILAYAIPSHDNSVTPGSRLVNFVWYRNHPEGGPFEDLMTDRWGARRTATMPPGALRPEVLEGLHRMAADVLAPTLAEVVVGSDATLIQAIFDLESPRMAFGRIALMGDAAFAVRPHLAAGQAKACADAWALRDALAATDGDVVAALGRWEPQQLDLGRSVLSRSRAMGHRSQVAGTMRPGDPDWKFGLFEPGN